MGNNMFLKITTCLSKYGLIVSGYGIAAVMGLTLGGWAGLQALVLIVNP